MTPDTTLLVADPSPLTGRILKLQLNPRIRIVVRQSATAAQRWLIAHRSQAAVVLVDDELVATIAPLAHKLDARCRIVALTHSRDFKSTTSLRTAGADTIVRKPIDLIALKRSLSGICRP